MIKEIKIKGLFNKFNYDIKFKEEGITILSGPNGYGKTTILKIIHALAIKNLFFFFQLPFKEISLIQEDSEITLFKIDDTIEILSGNEKIDTLRKEAIIKKIRHLLGHTPYYAQIDENNWIDRRDNTFYTTESLINQLGSKSKVQNSYIKQIPDIGKIVKLR